MTGAGGLPRGAALVLLLVDPRHRDTFAGDLIEERDRFVEPRRGHAAATRWFWSHLLRGALTGLAHRVAARIRGDRRLDDRDSARLGGRSPRPPRGERLLQDARYAVRHLRASPAFTAVAVLSLGLGIGANTAIFSLVNAVLMRRPPMAEPESLVEVYTNEPGEVIEYLPAAWGDLDDIDALDVFEGATAWEMFIASTQTDEGSEPILGEIVAGNFFDLLGAGMELGRGFLPEEDEVPERNPVAVLSHTYWTNAYGADPGVLGRDIRLNGRPYTIVGVAEPRFTGMIAALASDLWVPRMMIGHIAPFGGDMDRLADRGSRTAFVRARLAAGVTPERAQSVLDGLAARYREAYPEDWEDSSFRVVRTLDVSIHPQADRAIAPAAFLLMCVVGMVLLLACTNLAGFLLARGLDRRKEVALRIALGAGRGRLVRQLLTETTLLAVLGGALGVAIAAWSVRLLVRFQPPLPVPINLNLALDGRVLLFATAASLAAGLLFGLLPALQSTRPDLAPTLKDDGASVGARSRIRSTLLVGQVALSLVLLVGSGLFVQSLLSIQNVDPGFRTDGVGMLTVELSTSGYSDEEGAAVVEELKAQALADPGIDAVAAASRTPMNGTVQVSSFRVPGHENPEDPDGLFSFDPTSVDPAYFDVLGIPLLSGRGIEPQDDASSETVAVVNRSLAERFWPGESPIGRRVQRGETWLTIVGVVADTKIRTLGEAPRPQVFTPLAQRTSSMVTLIARGSRSATGLEERLHRVARGYDPDLVVMGRTTMEKQLGVTLFPARFAAWLLGLAGGLGLLLAAVGLYGVVSYSAARRTREVGIRMSLGADRRSVTRMVVMDGVKLVGIGSAIGLIAALLVSGLVARFLYGVSATDPVTFVGVPLVLGAVAFLAAWVPARRASGVDPVRALRS